MPDPTPLELVRTPRPSLAERRRRVSLVALGLGLLALVLLTVFGLIRRDPQGRPVVLTAPPGSHVAVDGDALPVLGTDGNHLFQLAPGTHELVITLRSGEEVRHEVLLAPEADRLRLALQWDRSSARFLVRDLDREEAEAEAEKEP